MERAATSVEVHSLEDRPGDDRRGARPEVSLLTSIEEWGAARVRAEWDRLLRSSNDRLALFQSPEWFDHLVTTEPTAHPELACVRDGDEGLIGVVPLVRTRHDLEYSIKRFTLGKLSLSVLEIPGNVPLLPEDTGVYDRVFEWLRQVASDLDGLYLRMVPTSSFCWRYLNESSVVRRSFALSLPDGLSQNNAVDLPPTFEEYLAHFKSKTRYNLRHRVKQLRERGGGELALRRFEAPDEVQEFLELAAPVASRSWQARCTNDRVDTTHFWRRKLTDLAERGMLRSYVLKSGSQHCAFAFGYQGRDVFHHLQTGYDPTFAACSPGAVLHFLLFEDLILHRPPRRTSFGYGDSEYKRIFGNTQFEEASVLLVNDRWVSRLKVHSYSAFRAMARGARTWIRRGPSQESAHRTGETKGRPWSSSDASST